MGLASALTALRSAVNARGRAPPRDLWCGVRMARCAHGGGTLRALRLVVYCTSMLTVSESLVLITCQWCGREDARLADLGGRRWRGV